MRKIFFGILLIFLPSILFSKDRPSAILLDTEFNSSYYGRGGAGVSICDGVRGLSINPATVFFEPNNELVCNYSLGVMDTYKGSVLYGHRFKNNVLAVSFSTLYGGIITLNPEEDKLIAQQDYLGSIGFCRKIISIKRTELPKKKTKFSRRKIKRTDELFFGVNMKYFNSTLVEEYFASTFAFDLGFLYTQKTKRYQKRFLSFGLVLKNLGFPYRYEHQKEPLPLSLQLGGSYGFTFPEGNSLLFCLDIMVPKESFSKKIKFTFKQSDVNPHLGIEYGYNNLFFLQAGYKFGYDIEGITLGIGIKYERFLLGYALGLRRYLNNEQQIEIGFRF